MPLSDPQKTPSDVSPVSEAEFDELREAVLDDWFRVTSSVTDAVTAIESTLSWRVTRPLRLVRLLQRKVGEIGVIPASQLAATAIARRLGR